MKLERFPIVSDDEIMLTEMPFMNLYDESDLISNIKGDYQDKNYLEWSPITTEKKSPTKAPEKLTEHKEKSYEQSMIYSHSQNYCSAKQTIKSILSV